MDNNINSEDLNDIINSAKMNSTDKEKLKDVVNSGDLSAFLKNLKPNDSQKLQKVLANKDEARRLLSTPQAQMLLKKLLDGKK